jgi:hypothetical protein
MKAVRGKAGGEQAGDAGGAGGVRAVVALAVALSLLVACGKKGAPDPPGPANQVRYPKVYPTH